MHSHRLIAVVVLVLGASAPPAQGESVFYETAPIRALNDVTNTVMRMQHPNDTTGWDISCGHDEFAPRETGACVTTYRVGPPGDPVVSVQPFVYFERPGRCLFQLRLLGDGVFNARTTTKRGTCLRIRAVRQEARR